MSRIVLGGVLLGVFVVRCFVCWKIWRAGGAVRRRADGENWGSHAMERGRGNLLECLFEAPAAASHNHQIAPAGFQCQISYLISSIPWGKER